MDLANIYGTKTETAEIELFGATFVVRHFNPSDPAYRATILEIAKPVKKALQHDLLNETDKRTIEIKAFCKAYLKGWSSPGRPNVITAGADRTYSEEEAVRLFTEFPRLYTDVVEAASEVANFRLSDGDLGN